ncbi:hypothetical protein P154DRAFT_528455 [Amniculicola lignicola CBS 123094]|uniref:F-box domain-containing protein n=1 Tax=Amniculicola lignicola CBS 123094 TaxID=1392246 RepID=A0A6A5X497_9PLEO|nr:hypothetical protein P154DRAFT_528455 [Amniculicola lignicola CBS 123094]
MDSLSKSGSRLEDLPNELLLAVLNNFRLPYIDDRVSHYYLHYKERRGLWRIWTSEGSLWNISLVNRRFRALATPLLYEAWANDIGQSELFARTLLSNLSLGKLVKRVYWSPVWENLIWLSEEVQRIFIARKLEELGHSFTITMAEDLRSNGGIGGELWEQHYLTTILICSPNIQQLYVDRVECPQHKCWVPSYMGLGGFHDFGKLKVMSFGSEGINSSLEDLVPLFSLPSLLELELWPINGIWKDPKAEQGYELGVAPFSSSIEHMRFPGGNAMDSATFKWLLKLPRTLKSFTLDTTNYTTVNSLVPPILDTALEIQRQSLEKICIRTFLPSDDEGMSPSKVASMFQDPLQSFHQFQALRYLETSFLPLKYENDVLEDVLGILPESLETLYLRLGFDNNMSPFLVPVLNRLATHGTSRLPNLREVRVGTSYGNYEDDDEFPTYPLKYGVPVWTQLGHLFGAQGIRLVVDDDAQELTETGDVRVMGCIGFVKSLASGSWGSFASTL